MFPKKDKQTALDLWFELYPSISVKAFVNELGYPSEGTMRKWIHGDPRDDPDKATYKSLPVLPKLEAIKRVSEGLSYAKAARAVGLTTKQVETAVNAYARYGTSGLLPKAKIARRAMGDKKDSRKKEKEPWERPPAIPKELPDDPKALKALVAELSMDNAILREVLDVLKADLGCEPSGLRPREKTRIVSRLSSYFSVRSLCERIGLARSTYYYDLRNPPEADPAKAIANEVERIFVERGASARGYRYVHAIYVREHGTTSEKVVRRAMRLRGLGVCYAKRRRRYSSYAGESGVAPPNLTILKDGTHNFSASRPNKLWLTDVTQFALGEDRLYLSAVIDAFDGKPIGWQTSKSPTAEMADASLLMACSQLGKGEHPIVHSDRGIHYFWPKWISICEEAGLTRSMSRKGRSPDNARMEGFFGCMKNEMFYGRDWRGYGIEDLANISNSWLERFSKERLKAFREDSGKTVYDTIDNRRRRLGLCA